MELKRNTRKYHNEKANFQGIAFDSLKEMKRFIVLRDAERKGIISNLERQPKYELIPAIWVEETKHLKTKDKVVRRCEQRAISYTADFRYQKNGETIVEDVKASPRLLPKEFQLKEKMMYYFHRVRIRKVYKANEKI